MTTIERLNAAFAGRYRLEEELGEGGMAKVFLAQDLRHDRQVAIKVLKPELAAVLGGERFVQEIKTTAQLQHPHILPLYDSGRVETEDDTEGTGPRTHLYYVMPYVEGETLRDKLDRETQLGVAEAVRIASDIADALDYAHRQGVIHRDIKPENILLHDGRPMVADFGIAIAVSAAAGGRMTETGLSLGTPYYMSPEQATADKEITGRTDVYSLASVLYEMLAGDPPHVGSSAQQIVMKILAETAAPVTAVRRNVPANVASAIAQGLEKLPADRFESARAFADALANPGFRTIAFAEAAPGASAIAGTRPPRFALVPVVAVAALGLAAWGWLRPTSESVPVVEFTLDLPEPDVVITGFDLDTEGRRIVVELDGGFTTTLYWRSLDDHRWQPIPGTEGAVTPSFSPDGTWIAYLDEGAVRRLRLSGGAPETIVEDPRANGGHVSWVDDRTLVYVRGNNLEEVDPEFGLILVDTESGVTRRLTSVGGGLLAHWVPNAGAGGDVVVFQGMDERYGATVQAVRVETGEVVYVTDGHSPKLDAAGNLVYVRGGIPYRQRFDLGTLRLEGEPVRVGPRVQMFFGLIGNLALGRDGSLVYAPSPNEGDRMVIVDRRGTVLRELVTSGSTGGLAHARFSPDGRRVAYTETTIADRGALYVVPVEDGTPQRLSFDDEVADPAWSPDGATVAYSAVPEEDGTAADLRVVAADGTGETRTIMAAGRLLWQVDFGATGDEIVFREGTDLFRATLGADGAPVPLTRTPVQEENPQLSPDGRWLAYRSDETGRQEVYVRSYPDMGPRTVVSTGGGSLPVWASDGRRLFYQDPTRIVEAELRFEGDRAIVEERTPLFPWNWIRPTANRSWDVSPDGELFVAVSGGSALPVWRVGALTSDDENR